jgi:RNA polymerase sigma factor (sigma-70 family)
VESVFDEYRGLLFRVAYSILGSVSGAEDIVQESWLKWDRRRRDDIASPRAFLVRIVTNLAVDELRAEKRRREDYVGVWLPEPLVTDNDPSESLVEAEDITLGMLVVLETLSPLERATFVLREAFRFDYGEIARILDRSSASVRKLAQRAREHVRARRPRFPADPLTAQAAARRFLDAALGGDMDALLEVVAPDAILYNDGGGKAPAALKPIYGATKVARLMASVGPRYALFDREWMVGVEPSVVLRDNDADIISVLAFEVDDSNLVRRAYGIVNPEKLRVPDQF